MGIDDTGSSLSPAEYLQRILTSRVYELARETPLDRASGLSRTCGATVLLKREDTQPSFSFKVRGAFNKMAADLATVDRERLWDPSARTWHGTGLNLVGSVLFGLSAIGAYTLPSTGDPLSLLWANLGTLLGAACFLVAAVLSRRPVHAPRRRERRPRPAAGAASDVGGAE